MLKSIGFISCITYKEREHAHEMHALAPLVRTRDSDDHACARDILYVTKIHTRQTSVPLCLRSVVQTGADGGCEEEGVCACVGSCSGWRKWNGLSVG